MSYKILSLRYKGDRDYLHGTDIFDQTLKWLVDENVSFKDIDFSFHRLARRQLQIVPGQLPEQTVPIAACTFVSDKKRSKIHLIETDDAITERYPYPEDEFIREMKIELATRSGRLCRDLPFSNIEIWVAMTKVLHYNVFPNLSGKWLFVRGRFPNYTSTSTSKAGEHTVAIVSSFNDRLTRSEVCLDGLKIGEIYFSIV